MNHGYKLLKLLGEGSFGKAYLCENLSDNSHCVIKQIPLDGLDEQEKKETYNEVLILKKVNHSNIIKFIDVFKKSKPINTLNIVTEYADDGDLNQKIEKLRQKKSPLTEKEIINYLIQICLALNHIHKKKIIHRDIKSGNIFLTKGGLVKLGDFGISKGFKNTWEKAKSKVGTPYYLSPEIINSKPYDSKSDIWALGVLLYEMMTFKMPFNANSLPALSLKILRGIYQCPSSYYSKDLINLVKQCLTIEPKRRPSAEMILKMNFIKQRICGYLDEINFNENLSMTVIRKYKEKKEKKIIKFNNKKEISNKNKNNNEINKKIKINFNNNKIFDNDKGKLINFFKKKNNAENNNMDNNKNNEKIGLKFKIVDNKDVKDKNNNEPLNFLRENKINIKNIKIVNLEKNLLKENQDKEKEQNDKLQNLISEDDIENLIENNQIKEEQYNQMRYLKNISQFAKQDIQEEIEEENNINIDNNNLETIKEESIQTENDSIKFNEIKINLDNNTKTKFNENKNLLNEDKELKELEKQLINEIGKDIYNMVYKYIDKYTDKTEIKFNSELIAEKLSQEFNKNKFLQNKLNLVIEKLPEIFVIFIQNRLNKG